MNDFNNHLKNIWSYISNNWISLSFFAIVPAVLLGLFFNPFRLITFLIKYPSMQVNYFGDIFNSQFGLLNLSWLSILKIVLLALLVSFILSALYGYIENHMRSGKKNFGAVMEYVNNNYIIVLFNILLLLITLFFVKFIVGGILFMLHITISGLGNVANMFNFIIAILVCAFTFVFVLQIVLVFLINIPNMILNGFTVSNALSNSISLVDKCNFKLIILCLLPFVLIVPLVILTFGSVWFNLAVGLSAFVLIVYYVCLGMVEYFALSETNRYDNRKYYLNY